ncbi:MAG TPA: DsrE/DsrF/DrsH-like family protein [Ktedonobacteraceae bacterium]|jgi:peroxiredoxin family protein|nr:DsrE/DsrF/DrsH-like family protein [Ktedonobacteraceae bacterium]
MEERMSLIVFSGTVDKLMAASILTTGAAAMGMEVEVFLTTWGLEAFRKDAYKTNQRVSKEFEDFAPVMMEQMQVKQVPSWMDNFKDARDIGAVKIYACSMTMELFGIKLADLEPIVDDVTGVATFVERARAGRITLFI